MNYYIAVCSFSGAESVRKGEIIVINDKNTAEDLLKAGYIEPIEKTKTVIDENQQYREI